MLKKYWITFKQDSRYDKYHAGYGFGIGVTAFTLDDAKNLIGEQIFRIGLPEIDVIKINVKYDDLDEGHVKPNMGTISNRGVWYPLGFASDKEYR